MYKNLYSIIFFKTLPPIIMLESSVSLIILLKIVVLCSYFLLTHDTFYLLTDFTPMTENKCPSGSVKTYNYQSYTNVNVCGKFLGN